MGRGTTVRDLSRQAVILTSLERLKEVNNDYCPTTMRLAELAAAAEGPDTPSPMGTSKESVEYREQIATAVGALAEQGYVEVLEPIAQHEDETKRRFSHRVALTA